VTERTTSPAPPASASAFQTHLSTDHVRDFVGAIARISTSGGDDLVQLDEIQILEIPAS
jgi:quinol monooxygenase YgiN